MERHYPTVDEALETDAGVRLPWGQIDSMVVRSDAEDDHALVVLELSVTPSQFGSARGAPVSAQTLGRCAALVVAVLATVGFGAEHWAVAALVSAAVGVVTSRIASLYGFRDENDPPTERENVRSVGVAVGLSTSTFEPSEVYGDVDRFEDVVAEINVASQFHECRSEALDRAWDAACLDNSPTRCPADDPDEWWAYWLAYRAVTRQNRRNTV